MQKGKRIRNPCNWVLFFPFFFPCPRTPRPTSRSSLGIRHRCSVTCKAARCAPPGSSPRTYVQETRTRGGMRDNTYAALSILASRAMPGWWVYVQGIQACKWISFDLSLLNRNVHPFLHPVVCTRPPPRSIGAPSPPKHTLEAPRRDVTLQFPAAALQAANFGLQLCELTPDMDVPGSYFVDAHCCTFAPQVQLTRALEKFWC